MQKLKVGHIGWLSLDEGPDCETVAWCEIRKESLLRAKERQPSKSMQAAPNGAPGTMPGIKSNLIFTV